MSFPDLLLKEDILLSGSDPVAEVVRSLESIKEQKRRVMSLPPNQKKIHLKRLLAMEKKRLRRLEFLRVVTEGKARETLEIPQQLQQSLDTLYNTSQQEALRDCLKASGITLIQGPPGTGKTTTIVGVLSVILNASVKRPILPHATYHDTQENDPDEPPTNGHSAMEDASTAGDQEAGTPMEDDWASGEPLQDELDGPETRPSGQQPLQNCSNANRRSKRPVTSSWMQAQPWIYNPSYVPWYDDVSLVAEDLELFIEKRAEHTDAVVELTNVHLDSQPRRILVCAPSNAAIDEILKRLTADPLKGGGILDSVGERYTPAVIRVGPNIHPDLTEYSLETRTNARIQTMGTTAFTARDVRSARRQTFSSILVLSYYLFSCCSGPLSLPFQVPFRVSFLVPFTNSWSVPPVTPCGAALGPFGVIFRILAGRGFRVL